MQIGLCLFDGHDSEATEPVVQMIWPTVNMWPSATAAKLGMTTIWFVWEAVRTPYLARHCRRNMVDSLPRGMPKVVDCWQTGAQAMD
jgi:hypothetical protein